MAKTNRFVPERAPRAPRKVPVKTLVCYDCNGSYEGHPSSRYCEFCSTSDLAIYKRTRAAEDKALEEERKRANERIDRLETMLRARGTHISQHPKPL